MEFIKSIYNVSSNKFNHFLNRNDNKINPERETTEINLLKKFNSLYFSEPDLIIDNIYLGNGHNAANLNTLNKFKINIIINVTNELDNYFDSLLIYYKLEVLDEKNAKISKYFNQFLNILKLHRDKNILVHCFMGSSRSAVLILLYLIKEKNIPYDKALNFLKEKRDVVNINNSFLLQLKNYIN